MLYLMTAFIDRTLVGADAAGVGIRLDDLLPGVDETPAADARRAGAPPLKMMGW